jgi:uncharacterized protein with FMN-binding domain
MRRVIAAFVATVAGLVLLLSFKIGPSKTTESLVPSSGLDSSGAAAGPDSSAPASSALPDPSAPDSPASSVAAAPSASVPSSASPTAAATPQATTKATTKATSSAKAKVSTPTTKTVTGSTVSVGERGQVFGSVQVRLTLVGGKITAVTELQVPQNDEHSSQLSQFAIPVLRSETLKAQGAGIDVVSGATYTSEAYAKSVQAALDAAKS